MRRYEQPNGSSLHSTLMLSTDSTQEEKIKGRDNNPDPPWQGWGVTSQDCGNPQQSEAVYSAHRNLSRTALTWEQRRIRAWKLDFRCQSYPEPVTSHKLGPHSFIELAWGNAAEARARIIEVYNWFAGKSVLAPSTQHRPSLTILAYPHLAISSHHSWTHPPGFRSCKISPLSPRRGDGACTL